jgi:hypothetical protein
MLHGLELLVIRQFTYEYMDIRNGINISILRANLTRFIHQLEN